MPERQFTKKETAKILRKAAEIQGGSGSGANSAKTSESELRLAAREVGIDASSLDEAIASVTRSDTSGTSRSSLRSSSDLVFEGTLTEDEWEETVADLRRAFGEQGRINVRGATREWSSGGELYLIQFSVREVSNQLRVSTSISAYGIAVLFYMLTMLPIMLGCGLIGKKAMLPPLWTGLAMLGVIGCSILLARGLVNRSAKSLHKSMAEAAERFRCRTKGTQFDQQSPVSVSCYIEDLEPRVSESI